MFIRKKMIELLLCIFTLSISFCAFAANNPPNLSGISLPSTSTGGKVYFSGSATDDQSISKVGMSVDGRIAFEQNVSGSSVNFASFWFDSSNSIYGHGTGSYSVVIWAIDNAGKETDKPFYITVNNIPPPANNPPNLSSIVLPSSSNGSKIYFSGFATDDQSISKVGMSVDGRIAFEQNVSGSSVNFASFWFDPNNSIYGHGDGYYSVVIWAIDNAGKETDKPFPVTVKKPTDNSQAIRDLQIKIDNAKNLVSSKNTQIQQFNADNSVKASDNSLLKNNLGAFNNTLINLKLPSPISANTSQNTSAIPSDCAPVSFPPNDLPILQGKTYQLIYGCGSTAKGSVYLLVGYTATYDGYKCTPPPQYSFLYPAAVLFLPNNMAPYIEKVSNIDQAQFWIGFYKRALDLNLNTAIAEAQSDADGAYTINHPNEGILSAISSEYGLFVTGLRDQIDDEIYELGFEDEADAKAIKELLSAGAGSIPYLQEAKGVTEICAGEDIITGEPVTIGWDSLFYVIPAGKIIQKFDKLKNTGKLSTAVITIVEKEGGVAPFAKKILDTGRKTSNQLGKWGEDTVRGKYNIGGKVTKTIGMGVDGKTPRLPDGLTKSTLSEVKNRSKLSCTQQLRDYAGYAAQSSRQFDLYVRKGLEDSLRKNPSFKAGGKCFPVNIISVDMPH